MRDLAEIRVRLEDAKRGREAGAYIGANTYDPIIADAESLLAAVEAIEAELDEWDAAAEPDGSTAMVPVRMAAALLRGIVIGSAVR